MDSVNEVKTPTEKKSSFIDSAIYISMLTGLGYLAAFYYEKSYLGYFGISEDFVILDLNTILVAISTIIITAAMFLGIMNLLSTMGLLDVHTAIARNRSATVVMVVSILFLLFINPPVNLLTLLVVFGFLGFFIFLQFGLPFFRKGVDYENKLRSQEELENKLLANSFLERILRQNSWFGNLLIFAFFIYFLASAAGLREAREKSQYLIISSRPNEIVIRVYQNELLLLPYDGNTNRIESKLNIIDRSSLYSAGATLENKNLKPTTP